MRPFRTAFCLVLLCAVPALATELPARKAGLWEIKTTVLQGHSISIQQCVDAQTDPAMQASFGSIPQRTGAKRDVRKSGDTTTIDSVCAVAGKTRTIHMVVTGSFDSSYTVAMTSQVEGNATARTMTMTAKWLGPCAAGQKPGDTIMPNGMKMNLLDLQKGAPGAPPH